MGGGACFPNPTKPPSELHSWGHPFPPPFSFPLLCPLNISRTPFLLACSHPQGTGDPHLCSGAFQLAPLVLPRRNWLRPLAPPLSSVHHQASRVRFLSSFATVLASPLPGVVPTSPSGCCCLPGTPLPMCTPPPGQMLPLAVPTYLYRVPGVVGNLEEAA